MCKIPSSSESTSDLQLPHSPDECEEYCAEHCVKNHQNNRAYREACLKAADKAFEDADADLDKAMKAFTKTLGQDTLDTKKGVKAAREAMEAVIAMGEESLEKLKKNQRIVAAVRKGRYLPDVESDEDL
ncbi:hypothetical protein MMC17_007912 [Xylographa soralifera]|nr:hypothetical protein [Xylographa soralifera]